MDFWSRLGDPASLAEALDKVIDDKDLAQRSGRMAESERRNFSPSRRSRMRSTAFQAFVAERRFCSLRVNPDALNRARR